MESTLLPSEGADSAILLNTVGEDGDDEADRAMAGCSGGGCDEGKDLSEISNGGWLVWAAPRVDL